MVSDVIQTFPSPWTLKFTAASHRGLQPASLCRPPGFAWALRPGTKKGEVLELAFPDLSSPLVGRRPALPLSQYHRRGVA